MDVSVVSRNSELYRLCRDILGKVAKNQWTVSIVEPERVPRGAGIYFWDSPHAPGAAGLPKVSTTHLFLASRKDLPGFQAPAGVSNPSIPLKPATRATLTTFLRQALTPYQDPQSETASRRARRDEVLHPMPHRTKRVPGIATAVFRRHVRRRPDVQPGRIQTCMEQALPERLTNIRHNACKGTARAGAIEVRGYLYSWRRRTSESRVKVERRRSRLPLAQFLPYRYLSFRAAHSRRAPDQPLRRIHLLQRRARPLGRRSWTCDLQNDRYRP
jgi:hypothetical protein